MMAVSARQIHIPVMVEEVINLLQPAPGKIFVDGTLGMGGHAEAILGFIPGGKLIGIDQDAEALALAKERLSHFGGSFVPIKGNFAQIDQILDLLQIDMIDGILLDLGVSSLHLDSGARGFSYRNDVFLDMRMDLDLGLTAADLLARLSVKELTYIFRRYGEEKWASRVAIFIERYRRTRGPVLRSGQLVDIITSAIPAAARRRGGRPDKRIFQALRSFLNKELESLTECLEKVTPLLRPGGRIVVLSYQSLEDEIVKGRFRDDARGCICPPEIPVCCCGRVPLLKILTRKPLYPTDKEKSINPRSASARLRAAERLPLKDSGQ